MADNPRMPAHADKDANKCRDGHEECEDCRETDISKIKSVHFTICQKPWNCKPFANGSLCNDFHHKWFQVRKSLEDRWAEITGDESLIEKRNGSYHPDHFMGYCNHAGTGGYIPAVVPECVENECKSFIAIFISTLTLVFVRYARKEYSYVFYVVQLFEQYPHLVKFNTVTRLHPGSLGRCSRSQSFCKW